MINFEASEQKEFRPSVLFYERKLFFMTLGDNRMRSAVQPLYDTTCIGRTILILQFASLKTWSHG